MGAFLALWVIGYGFIQAAVPEILRQFGRGNNVDGHAARLWAFVLVFIPSAILGALSLGADPAITLIVGLAVIAVAFAINSAVHCYLVLVYTDIDNIAVDVGFYYMANVDGRLLGTLLSGVMFQLAGFDGCLTVSAALALISTLLALKLPRGKGASQ